MRGVFNSVASRYDLMNDLMSGGVHRLWKAAMIDWMAPQPHQKLVDLAGGTGDISMRFLSNGGGLACITDINHAMLQAGRSRRDLQRMASQISWCVANAESLPFDEPNRRFRHDRLWPSQYNRPASRIERSISNSKTRWTVSLS